MGSHQLALLRCWKMGSQSLTSFPTSARIASRSLNIGGPSGKDGEFVVKTVEVEFGDDAVVSLLQYEPSAFDRKLTCNQFVFPLRELETFDVVGMAAA